MTAKHRSFAPPPAHWPGKPPAGARVPAVQAFRTFDPLRTQKTERGGTADELVALHDGQFQLETADRGLRIKPNGTYNFVRVHGTTRNDAHTFVSNKASHAKLAGGRPVLYAGTIRFDNGSLDWWSNYSGTYQPIAAFRQQAQLPGDRFVPWQRLQMGGNSMQRGMFTDRHGASAPAVRKPKAPAGRAEQEGADAGSRAAPSLASSATTAPAATAKPATAEKGKPS
jgi:hypothetical protein